MELATGTLLVQAPKTLAANAWSQFLQRVLVSVGRDGDSDSEERVAERLVPRLAPASNPGEGSASERQEA
ncbi:hypothetical protein GCM10009416_23420 [Craurococcus roseus]|uniref:Uncharacterized protein n=1 Tax=Craurococcus roseus TaxID=77585 RepID=A0ABN1F7C5_9PROT